MQGLNRELYKKLLLGDALVVEVDKLCMAMPQFVLNMQDAQDSIRNLQNYDIEKIICYHGGFYKSDVKSSLKGNDRKFQVMSIMRNREIPISLYSEA